MVRVQAHVLEVHFGRVMQVVSDGHLEEVIEEGITEALRVRVFAVGVGVGSGRPHNGQQMQGRFAEHDLVEVQSEHESDGEFQKLIERVKDERMDDVRIASALMMMLVQPVIFALVHPRMDVSHANIILDQCRNPKVARHDHH